MQLEQYGFCEPGEGGPFVAAGETGPGGRIPTHIHERMDESEYVLTDGLTGWWTGAGPRVLPRGHSVRWPIGLPHGYQNDTTAPQAVLCIDRPPFDPSDEILLEPDAPARLHAEIVEGAGQVLGLADGGLLERRLGRRARSAGRPRRRPL